MAKHRCHSIEFKRQVAQEFIAGEPRNLGLCKLGAPKRVPPMRWLQMTDGRRHGCRPPPDRPGPGAPDS